MTQSYRACKMAASCNYYLKAWLLGSCVWVIVAFLVYGGDITLTIKDDNDVGENYCFSFQGSQIRLERNGNTQGKNSLNDNLHPVIKITDNNGTLLQSNTVSIVSGSNLHLVDKLVYKVHGTLKTSNAAQNTGEYKGAIKVTAKYDDWPTK